MLLEAIPALGEQLTFNLEDARLPLFGRTLEEKACLEQAGLAEF